MTKKNKATPFLLGLLTLLLIGGGVYILAQSGWQEPTATPPGDNVSAPINVGPQAQSKEGDLSIGPGLKYWITKLGDSFALKNDEGEIKFVLGQDGKVGINTTSPTEELEVKGGVKITDSITLRDKTITGFPIGECPGGAIQRINPDGSLECIGGVQPLPLLFGCRDEEEGLPSGAKLAFVTSIPYIGNLGGLAGADAKCAARAEEAVELYGVSFLAGKSWRALLAGPYSPHPKDRLKEGNFSYWIRAKTFEGVKLCPIANDWLDLWDGQLITPINANEKGDWMKGVDVWTHVKAKIGPGPSLEFEEFITGGWADYCVVGGYPYKHVKITGACSVWENYGGGGRGWLGVPGTPEVNSGTGWTFSGTPECAPPYPWMEPSYAENWSFLGKSDFTTYRWLSGTAAGYSPRTKACSQEAHLYCFEY
jgi:hypothetical protein